LGGVTAPDIPRRTTKQKAGCRVSTIFRNLLSICLIAAAVRVAHAEAPLAPGERLQFEVSWAIVPGAGEIVVSAEQGEPGEVKVTTKTSTRGLARLLLPFDATAEGLYDTKTGRLSSLHDRSSTRGKYAEHMVTFDYERREARYAVIGATTAEMIPIPEGSPTDLITALLSTRQWQLKPGDARDAVVLFNDDFYLLTIHAEKYETLDTDLGRFKALVLEPRMEKTPPKGMFKKGSTVRVWISDDERRLPLKFEVEFSIGTGVATLEDYTPPKAASSAPSATAHASTGK
jgi:hypothetical protein